MTMQQTIEDSAARTVPVAANLAAENSAAAEVEQLLGTLREEGKRHKPTVRFALLACWAVVTGLVALTFLQNDGRDWLQGLCVLGSVAAMGLYLRRMVASRLQKETVHRLAVIDSLDALPTLIDAFTWPERSIQDAVANSLVRTLPRLKASDSELLSARHVEILCRSLSHSNVALTIAILRALEQIGDIKAIPYVERLANRALLGDGEVRVRVVAADCLAALQVRIDREGHRLLRPVDTCPDSSILLKPASNDKTEVAGVLLRPASNT